MEPVGNLCQGRYKLRRFKIFYLKIIQLALVVSLIDLGQESVAIEKRICHPKIEYNRFLLGDFKIHLILEIPDKRIQ